MAQTLSANEAMSLHAAAVTRDYIQAPRIGKWERSQYSPPGAWLLLERPQYGKINGK